MKSSKKFSAEVRERAVRLVGEARKDYDSEWAPLCSIAPKIGCTTETLRKWVRRAERDAGLGRDLPRRRPSASRISSVRSVS